jgi:hypothetical protein
MMSNSYKTDIGTVITLNVGVVIVGASPVTVEVKKPSGVSASWPATVGADTKSIEHIVVAGDFSESGTYIMQAKVVIGSSVWLGQSVKYLVQETFA